ncbi:Holliday junction DNA helicase subunit RuvA [Chitinophaga terrae (ex Kim and Jung 2007)]|jgi:Holliday junction DNA helicase RuvA|uniref:Holliday junction branch migration complex subunit RuvA n=1 Tax=Chitinophaga terrae (ex Kim and Jung 2007) TaxID=408074 RepID=A0A1H4DD16_9BACT|nr:Holliday junction branch migration protein RuvA [Chitinophaga terrae (ex Kim and Jung 2007)]MDQ0107773.1 Holliday junction DNA helicase RuvA [Chitinophaga terrae (ex Kim and Jung 2007)]GEP92591.1 Holliday junction ATP-dependent DNA helicase RuvA [Chitinophaga terrae (ex Kim and Jung 2007)]SEA70152.1 Holliday junction DNA helicase subunit RuvA [Chitinophaga terrae (ex Kim and Jung 2007)]
MIAYLSGKLAYKSPALVHLDVNGIGYEVQISLNTYSRIQDLESCKLLTFLQIKEDAHTLYGFFEEAERSLFLLLISVSGVGASTARMMLSSLQPEDIQRAIMMENDKMLESVKGIGAKTAKRIILELKDKIKKHKDAGIQLSASVNNTMQEDALNALVTLGIARNMAETAVQKVMKNEPLLQNLEELIKKALKSL